MKTAKVEELDADDTLGDTTGKSPSKLSYNSKCNFYNLLNCVGYLVSLITSYLGGVAGWFGTNNAELSSKYQTVITPSATYFGYIWGAIYIFEGFFTIAQILPKYREQPLVQKGVGSTYFLVCAAQSAWTITFGYELLVAAFVAMVGIFLSLMFILKRQWDVVTEENKKTKAAENLGETEEEAVEEDATFPPPRPGYWCLRFPFPLHAGWISVATPLMLSVLLVSRDVEPEYELWAAVISLPLLFGACMGLLLREDKGAPSYIYPATVAYGCIGICWELTAPSQAILERHEVASIGLMKNLSGFCGGCLLITIVSRFIALFLRDQCMKCNKKDESVSMNDEEFEYVQA